MPNRNLTPEELDRVRELLRLVRSELVRLSDGDPELLFAYRRKVYKELTYDERDKPLFRRKLKEQKRREQGGICPICELPLPEKYCVLDRYRAADGYTAANTRLLCPQCDIRVQTDRKFA